MQLWLDAIEWQVICCALHTFMAKMWPLYVWRNRKFHKAEYTLMLGPGVMITRSYCILDYFLRWHYRRILYRPFTLWSHTIAFIPWNLQIILCGLVWVWMELHTGLQYFPWKYPNRHHFHYLFVMYKPCKWV